MATLFLLLVLNPLAITLAKSMPFIKTLALYSTVHLFGDLHCCEELLSVKILVHRSSGNPPAQVSAWNHSLSRSYLTANVVFAVCTVLQTPDHDHIERNHGRPADHHAGGNGGPLCPRLSCGACERKNLVRRPFRCMDKWGTVLSCELI